MAKSDLLALLAVLQFSAVLSFSPLAPASISHRHAGVACRNFHNVLRESSRWPRIQSGPLVLRAKTEQAAKEDKKTSVLETTVNLVKGSFQLFLAAVKGFIARILAFFSALFGLQTRSPKEEVKDTSATTKLEIKADAVVSSPPSTSVSEPKAEVLASVKAPEKELVKNTKSKEASVVDKTKEAVKFVGEMKAAVTPTKPAVEETKEESAKADEEKKVADAKAKEMAAAAEKKKMEEEKKKEEEKKREEEKAKETAAAAEMKKQEDKKRAEEKKKEEEKKAKDIVASQPPAVSAPPPSPPAAEKQEEKKEKEEETSSEVPAVPNTPKAKDTLSVVEEEKTETVPRKPKVTELVAPIRGPSTPPRTNQPGMALLTGVAVPAGAAAWLVGQQSGYVVADAAVTAILLILLLITDNIGGDAK